MKKIMILISLVGLFSLLTACGGDDAAKKEQDEIISKGSKNIPEYGSQPDEEIHLPF